MALQLIDITKFYQSGKTRQLVINNLTIKFPDYGMIGVIGISGSGKSTLLNMIAGIEKPSLGKILIDGHELNYRQINDYRKAYISYVYQFYNLIDALTVKENILLMAKIKGVQEHNQLYHYLQILKLEGLLDVYPSSLSGGQKQRVGLIRAFLCNSPILLADEPTGAINESLSQEVMEQLKQYSKKHLVIVISHNRTLLKQYTNQIINLDSEVNYYDFSNHRYHKYHQSFLSSQSARLFFYIKRQLFYQKKKIMMMFVSQILIMLAYILLISACNGGWLYLEKRINNDPLKEMIEVSKTDYSKPIFTKGETAKLKQDPLIDDVSYRLDFSLVIFTKKQSFNVFQIKETKDLSFNKGYYPKANNQVLINQSAANKYHLRLNDQITFKLDDHKYSLTIKGIINDAVNSGTNLYVDKHFLSKQLIKQLVLKDSLIIHSSKVEKLINKYASKYLMINFHQDYLNNYQAIFKLANFVVAIFLIVSFAISLILISIILKTIFIERKKDTSLLLVSGLSKVKVSWLFCIEAMMIGGLLGISGAIVSKGVLIIINGFNLSEKLFNIPDLFVLPKIFISSYDCLLLLIVAYMFACLLAGVISSLRIYKMNLSTLMKEN